LEPEIPKLDEKYHESLDKKPEHLDVKPEPSEKAVKKRRIYENAAPVYDNRQIYAADLLQTQLDYPDDLMDDLDGDYGGSDISPVSGVEDCGPFKKVWSSTYLCFNLGKEILCLLCFCRFTQFKKFNLERHMRKKHPGYYQLNDQVKKKVLDVLVDRYEDMATPTIVATVPSQGNQHMVADILQMDTIEWSCILGEDLAFKREDLSGDQHLADHASGDQQLYHEDDNNHGGLHLFGDQPQPGDNPARNLSF